jgi:hypothetical protein
MNAGKSKWIGEIVNGCEVIASIPKTKQFQLQCTKCGSIFKRNRATVATGKAKCECSYTRQTRHTDGFCNTKLKSVYLNMLDRCYNKNCHAYKDYGARGIGVDAGWTVDFRHFYNWAIENGYRDGLTLDRIDNDGWYCPENCRWVDRKTQANNRRSCVGVMHEGRIYTIAQLAELLGVPYQTLYSRIRRAESESE